jgi:hypothetical protein
MKISELCNMVQDSIYSGKYPLEDNQRSLANSVQVINRSSSDDLKSNDIRIEVRLQDISGSDSRNASTVDLEPL